MDYELLKRNATKRFKEYTDNYDLSDPKIALKAAHTYRVADFCEQIAISEGLSDEDVLIAWYTGLLHDIGRFEQVSRFNTFYDSISVDHGHLSCEILWGTNTIPKAYRCPGGNIEPGIIREFVPDDLYDDIIYTAIWQHSIYKIDDNMDDRTKMFCNILRDADKIDIFRVNMETPMNEIHNVPIEEFYNSEITPEVLNSFYEHHCVLRSLKKTAIDHVVGYISLYWELVFPQSKKIALDKGYFKSLCNFESQNPNTRKAFEEIRMELGI